ncbi:hypothetical protein TNIN_32711 [Trichonephila inaurata madagascariensis]|uniref:Uncharacterized protein n=1 Tax=Trichonephila inaurata madagascariensis TaxID=2747483 RepID=A0A8X6WU37_9ARAC|nr:hypothetical protein TNIN_32711 [Trichonephila inaurata madagascariensis]
MVQFQTQGGMDSKRNLLDFRMRPMGPNGDNGFNQIGKTGCLTLQQSTKGGIPCRDFLSIRGEAFWLQITSNMGHFYFPPCHNGRWESTAPPPAIDRKSQTLKFLG